MKIIRDAIHAGIELNDLELAVLDTKEMQRLRFVRQLALAHLVYPSAHHTRFEHSLGTFHLTGLAAARLLDSEEDRQRLRLAGLLHDVGHSAFSHLPETLVKKLTGKNHEELGYDKIRRSHIGDVLNTYGYSPESLLKLMHGPKYAVVCTEYGTDRVDYLLRDAHFTGAAYSLVDAERLLQSLQFQDGTLVLLEKGVLPAESLLVSRYLMFRAVYHHHANRIATAMLQKALQDALEKRLLAVQDIADGADDEVLFKLKDQPLIQRIRYRRMFKTAFASEQTTPKQASALEKELQKRFDPQSFVVCHADEGLGGADVPVQRKDGSLSSLFRLSMLSKSLAQQLKANEVLVACAPELKERVAKACRKF